MRQKLIASMAAVDQFSDDKIRKVQFTLKSFEKSLILKLEQRFFLNPLG